MAKVAALSVPVPPLGVAPTIDCALDATEAKAESLTREARRVLALLDHLERSILTRAFRGELVPQNPTDEPASVTLARAEGSVTAQPKRGRPRRVA